MGVKKGSPGVKSPPDKAGKPKDTALETAKLRSGVDSLHGFYPRVWVTLGQKIQVKDYEPIDVQLGYSEDVRAGDTVDAVFNKIVAKVKQRIKPLIQEAEQAKKQFSKNKK